MQTIVVLEGDQTGQELLEEALRTLSADVISVELGFPRFDLSLENRRATNNRVVYDAAAAISTPCASWPNIALQRPRSESTGTG